MIRVSAIRIRPSRILRFLTPFRVLPPYPLQHFKEFHSPLIPQQKHSLPNSSHPGFGACNWHRDENWLPPPPIHPALHRAKPNIFPLRILSPKTHCPLKNLLRFSRNGQAGDGALVGEVNGQTCPQQLMELLLKPKAHLRFLLRFCRFFPCVLPNSEFFPKHSPTNETFLSATAKARLHTFLAKSATCGGR